MEPTISDTREKEERRKSIHRTSTAPPDAQEPQYHTYKLNVGAEAFTPFNPTSNINPQAKPFEPLGEFLQSSHEVKLSARAEEFVPSFSSNNTLPKKASAWDRGVGPSLKSPTMLPATKEDEMKTTSAEKELKEEKSISTEAEQQEKPTALLLTTDNNQTQIPSQSQPDLETQIIPSEILPSTQTELESNNQPTPIPQQILHETESGRSELLQIQPQELILEDPKTQPKPTEIELPSTKDQPKEHVTQTVEPKKVINEPLNQTQALSEEEVRRYSYEHICAVESQVNDSDFDPKTLAFANRTIRTESWTFNSHFKPQMRKKARVPNDKRRQTIERQVIEENKDSKDNKDNPQWRFINEQVELIAQKAKENTKKISTVHEGDDKVQRQLKITLNKLTPSNFEKLKESLLQIALDNDANVKYLVDGIFLKACTETKYTPMFAKLCNYLLEEYHKIKFNEEFSKSRDNKRSNSFRRELLHNCQSVFEFNPQEENYEGLSEEDAQIKKDKLKKKILGNVRLVGELFKLGLILNKIVLYCIEDLIHPQFKNESELDYSPHNFNEEKLEGACILLKTGGSSFEKTTVIAYTDKVFRVLQQIVDRNIASARTKFLIMNVFDARRGGWRTEEQDMPQVIA